MERSGNLLILEVERLGGTNTTSKSRRRELRTHAERGGNVRDQLVFRDKTETIIYMTGQCRILKRNAEDIERQCKVRGDRTTLSTGKMKGKYRESGKEVER